MRIKQQNVINNYNSLLKQYQRNEDKMSNLGREKDYKVQKISKEYELKIENCIRVQSALKIQLENIQKYIRNEKESN